MRSWLILLSIVLFGCPALAEGWPSGFEDVERIALREPGPGSAFAHVCQIAAASGQLSELRARWRKRGDAAGLILLGWLEQETGNSKEASAMFDRAVELAPESFHAQWARAWALAQAGDPGAEKAAQRAADLARSPDQRHAAVRVIPNRLCAKGDIEGARQHLRMQHAAAKDPLLRLALIPDLAHAALADGTVSKWLSKLAEEKSNGSPDSIAEYAAACLEVGEPALALQEVNLGLAKHADSTPLVAVGAASAARAGLITDFATLTMKLLGANPSPEEVGVAMLHLIEAPAGRAIGDIAERYPAALAASSSLWRKKLPTLREIGVLPKVRSALEKGRADDEWEGTLALAELAVLENDHAKAAAHFWEILSPRGDARPIATLISSAGNLKWTVARNTLPLEGTQLHDRCREARELYAHPSAIFSSDRDDSNWTTPTLTDARDYALVCLHQLARREGKENEFLGRLDALIGTWPLSERLIAAAIIGSPSRIMDALEEIARLDAASHDSKLLNFSANQLAHLRGLLWLDPKLAVRAAAIRLPETKPLPSSRFVPLWQQTLWQCFDHFLAGRLEKAAAAFAKAEGLLRACEIQNVEHFHNSLISALDRVPVETRGAASGAILEWMARETATRLELPNAPDFSILTREFESPRMWHRMFVPDGANNVQIFGGMVYVPFPGGWIPRAQSESVFYWSVLNRHFPNATEQFANAKLSGHARHILASYYALLAAWRADEKRGPLLLAELEKNQEEYCAPILRAWLQAWFGRMGAPADPPQPAVPEVKGFDPTFFSSGAVAQAILDPAKAQLDKLAPLHLASAEQLQLLSTVEPPIAAKLALRWTPKQITQPELPDVPLLLRKLLLTAEMDQAATVAMSVLRDMRAPRQISEEFYFVPGLAVPRDIVPRDAALLALEELGESRRWLDELERRMKETPADLEVLWKAMEAARFALREVGLGRAGSEPGPLPPMLAQAKKTFITALAALCAREPSPAVWMERQKVEPKGDTAVPSALVEYLQKPETALTAYELSKLVGALSLLDRAAVLARRASVRKSARWHPHDDLSSLFALADPLWSAGMVDEALSWWRHVLDREHPVDEGFVHVRGLFTTCAAAKAPEALADVIAEAVRTQSRTDRDTLCFPLVNRWHGVTRAPPIRALFDAAVQHGVLRGVLERVARQEPSGPDVALFFRLLSGDPSATPEVRARFDEHAARPMPNAVLDGLAEPLSDHAETRDLAARMLAELKAFRAVPDTDLSIPRLARHGRIGLAAGSPEANKWIALASLRLDSLASSDQLSLMPDLLEATAQSKAPALFEHVSKIHSGLYARETFSLDPLFAWMERASQRSDPRLFTALAQCVQGSLAFQNAEEGIREAFAAQTRHFDARHGRFESSAPFAWLLPHAAAAPAEEREVAWDFGWISGSAGRETSSLTVTDAQSKRESDTCAVELYWGEHKERLELLQRLERVKPNGSAKVRLPSNARYLAVHIKVDEQTILGAARSVAPRAQFVALSDKLRPPEWQEKVGGPLGRYFVRPPASEAAPGWGTLLGRLTPDKTSQVTISAWVRRGGISVVCLDAGGKLAGSFRMNDPSKVGWSLLETTADFGTYPAAAQRLPDETTTIEVYAHPGTEIGGLAFEHLPKLPKR